MRHNFSLAENTRTQRRLSLVPRTHSPIVIQILCFAIKKRIIDGATRKKSALEINSSCAASCEYVLCMCSPATSLLSSTSTRYGIQFSTPLKINSMRKLFLFLSRRYFVLREFMYSFLSICNFFHVRRHRHHHRFRHRYHHHHTTEQSLCGKLLILWR